MKTFNQLRLIAALMLIAAITAANALMPFRSISMAIKYVSSTNYSSSVGTVLTGSTAFGPCNLATVHVINTTTAPVYICIYDLNRAPVVGTDLPIWSGLVEPSFGGVPQSAVFGASYFTTNGLPMQSGLQWALSSALTPQTSAGLNPANYMVLVTKV